MAGRPPNKSKAQLKIEQAEQKVAKKDFIERYVKNKCHIAKTCRATNIGRTTIYLWRDNDPVFKQDLKDAKEEQKDDAEDALQRAIRENNITALIFFLKTQCKDRGYIERSEIDNKHEFKSPVTILLPHNGRNDIKIKPKKPNTKDKK